MLQRRWFAGPLASPPVVPPRWERSRGLSRPSGRAGPQRAGRGSPTDRNKLLCVSPRHLLDSHCFPWSLPGAAGHLILIQYISKSSLLVSLAASQVVAGYVGIAPLWTAQTSSVSIITESSVDRPRLWDISTRTRILNLISKRPTFSFMMRMKFSCFEITICGSYKERADLFIKWCISLAGHFLTKCVKYISFFSFQELVFSR